MKSKRFSWVAMILAIMAFGSSLYAVSYSGDIQLQLGFRDVVPTYNTGDIMRMGSDDIVVDQFNFEFALENYNLFNVNSIFSVGFFEGFNGYVGSVADFSIGDLDSDDDTDYGLSMGFTFAIGPAIGVKLGKVVKFQVGLGLTLGINSGWLYDSDDESMCLGTPISVGFQAGLQAKFLPHSIVSPVIGLRYAFMHANKYLCTLSVGDVDIMDAEEISEACNIQNLAVYLGLSINLGKR